LRKNIAVSLLLLTFKLSDSGGPAVVDVRDGPTIPSTTVISDANSVTAVQ
jgi:hypothetical protein